MRPAVVLLLAVLAAAPAGAAPPRIGATLAPDFSVVFPDKPATINGTFTIGLPPDADCQEDLRYGFQVDPGTTSGLNLTVGTPNGSIPAAQITPNANVTRPLSLTLAAGRDLVAFTRLDALVRIRTEACGNVEEASVVAQTGARVGFFPKVRLEILEEHASSWKVRVTNEGNAHSDVNWVARQPALGKVISGGVTDVPGPDTPDANRSRDILVARGNIDETKRVVLDAHVVYAGMHAYDPDERPPVGLDTITLHEPPAPPGASRVTLQTILLVAAVALIGAGVVGGWWLRRRRP